MWKLFKNCNVIFFFFPHCSLMKYSILSSETSENVESGEWRAKECRQNAVSKGWAVHSIRTLVVSCCKGMHKSKECVIVGFAGEEKSNHPKTLVYSGQGFWAKVVRKDHAQRWELFNFAFVIKCSAKRSNSLKQAFWRHSPISPEVEEADLAHDSRLFTLVWQWLSTSFLFLSVATFDSFSFDPCVWLSRLACVN